MKKIFSKIIILTVIITFSYCVSYPTLLFATNTYSIDLERNSSQYLTAADSTSLSITGNLTWECWIKLESLPATDTTNSIVGKGDVATYAGEWFLTVQNDAGTYYLNSYWSNGVDTAATKKVAWTPTIGVWYHVAVTHDTSGNIIFYVNGTQQGTTQTGAPGTLGDSTHVFHIGSYFVSGAHSNFWDGLIDDCRLWNVVRTQTEINDNKSIEIDTATSLNASWHLNNVYTDSSGNANTLTAVNSPVFSTDVPFGAAAAAPSIESDLILFEE